MALTDRTLMAAALGLLDPGDAEALDETLGAPEALRQSGLAALADVPLAHTLPGPRATRGGAGVLAGSERRIRPGQRVSFALDWPDLPANARCAVFRRVGPLVERIYPSGPIWTPLSSFRQREGRPLLELVVEPPAGLQRIDAVLVAGELAAEAWPDDSPWWGRIHEAWLAGRGYGVTLELEVG